MATIEHAGRVWRIREQVNGKRQTVATATSKAEAQIIQRRLEQRARAQSTVVRGATVELGELIVRWQKAKIALGNDPMHTAGAAERLRRLCEKRNWIYTNTITPQEVDAYRMDDGCARTCGYMAALLRWSADTYDQLVDKRALVRLRPGKAARKPKGDMLTIDQVRAAEAFAASLSANAGVLIHCLSTYGWRPITAARLKVGDFDPVKGEITTLVKGGDIVRHPLQPSTLIRLRAIVAGRGASEPLFVDPFTGDKWDPARGISLFSRGHLKLRVYDLKRHAISTMLGKGLAPHVIALFTGHRTIGQVLRYARTNDEIARAALAQLGDTGQQSPPPTSGDQPEQLEKDQSRPAPGPEAAAAMPSPADVASVLQFAIDDQNAAGGHVG